MITLQQLVDSETTIDGQTYNRINEMDECEENEQHITKGRKKTNRSARIREYVDQMICNAKQRVRNILDNRRNKKTNESNETQSDDTGTEITSGQNSTKESSQYIIGNRSDNEGQDKKGKNYSDEGKSYSYENKSNNAENSDGNKTSDRPNNANSTENCDVCDESRIYTVFKDLREKLSFNE